MPEEKPNSKKESSGNFDSHEPALGGPLEKLDPEAPCPPVSAPGRNLHTYYLGLCIDYEGDSCNEE